MHKEFTTSYNNIETFLGVYKTEEDAAIAYDMAAKKIYGKNARLNFPNSKNSKVPKRLIRRRKVVQMKDGKIIAEFQSIKEASFANKCLSTSIVNCCRGYIKTSGGFNWKYA
jgi:hypothetical protein